MNPAIVIPTYWSHRRSLGSAERNAIYDNMTPIDKPGNLAGCLDSLTRVKGAKRVIILVAAESGVEGQAAEKVRSIAAHYPKLDVAVVSQPEVRHIHRRMEEAGMGALSSCVCLNGYGAIRNLGLLATSIFGCDVAVFLDANVVISGTDFLERALYGIGAKTPSGSIITAKTGLLLNQRNNPTKPVDKRWYRKDWDKAQGFNEYITNAVRGPRLSRANIANGAVMVLHADAFGAVSFDPWITRGEDLDYVISSRMYSRDVWLDNKLTVLQSDSTSKLDSRHFRQDVIRWYYENRKIEFAKAQIDLMQIDSKSFDPYPGPFLTKRIGSKVLRSSLLSVIGDPEHGAYWEILTKGRKEAEAYARDNCSRYFEFQRQWPTLVRGLWNDTPLATQLSGARAVPTTSAGFTGRFSAISVD